MQQDPTRESIPNVATHCQYLIPFTEPIRVPLPEEYLKPIWIIGKLHDLAKRTKRDDIVYEFELGGIIVRVNRKTHAQQLACRLENMIDGRCAESICGP